MSTSPTSSDGTRQLWPRPPTCPSPTTPGGRTGPAAKSRRCRARFVRQQWSPISTRTSARVGALGASWSSRWWRHQRADRIRRRSRRKKRHESLHVLSYTISPISGLSTAENRVSSHWGLSNWNRFHSPGSGVQQAHASARGPAPIPRCRSSMSTRPAREPVRCLGHAREPGAYDTNVGSLPRRRSGTDGDCRRERRALRSVVSHRRLVGRCGGDRSLAHEQSPASVAVHSATSADARGR
jgi:hypothetical protein